jgi:sugar lactone lactonase YvrE
MRTLRLSLAGTVILALLVGLAPAVSARGETLVTFDAGASELPEGVTVDGDGNVFAGLSPLGRLVRIAAGSAVAEPHGTVEGLADGDQGLTGLATDASGNIYGAVNSTVPEVHGVWRFDHETGDAERVLGTEAIVYPNAVAFGPDGTMYVTDMVGGAIWHATEGGPAEPWLVDPILEGTGEFPFPVPLGANGIDVVDTTVIVGVTETALIVGVPIELDGTAGAATILARLDGVVVDGVAVDADGDIYVADPINNEILRVSAAGDIEVVADVLDGLDGPTSLDLAIDADGTTRLYIANYSVALGTELGAGPSVVAVEVE